MRRSCSSPIPYLEHVVVRQHVFVPCLTGFQLFDIAERDDWIPSLGKKSVVKRKKNPRSLTLWSSQVVKRSNARSDESMMSEEVRVSNWFQRVWLRDLWSSVWRSTRNYYLLSSLWRESVSPKRTFPVNVTNPCNRRVQCQVAIIVNWFSRGRFWENTWKYINDANLYILIFWDVDEKYDWKNNAVYDNWIRKIKKRQVIDLENVFFKDIGSRKRNLQTFVFLRHSAQTYLMYLIKRAVVRTGLKHIFL